MEETPSTNPVLMKLLDEFVQRDFVRTRNTIEKIAIRLNQETEGEQHERPLQD